nr:MAG TPA: hypothetical protein [Caudoviricetes sp.]
MAAAVGVGWPAPNPRGYFTHPIVLLALKETNQFFA